MNSVERVIFDVLARRGSVALPGVGSLEVKRRKAHRVSETRVIPPQNVVVFSHDEPREMTSVVDLLNRNANISMDDAWATYNEWVGEARQDGALVIEGVGTVRDEHFEPTDHLHEMLNPAGASEEEHIEGEDYSRERRRKGLGWWWLLIVLGALALAFAVLWFFCPDARQGFIDGWNSARREKTEVIVPAPVVDTVKVVEPVAAVPVGPRYHVIAGAFLVPGNAEKLMTELRRDYPELTVSKVQNPNGYEMVSIFSSPDRAAAQRELNRNLDLDPCGWVWEEN